MASIGNAYIDRKGQYHKTQDEATKADLAAVLGKVGDGESLAPGIASTLLDKRSDIEEIFAEHDIMTKGCVG